MREFINIVREAAEQPNELTKFFAELEQHSIRPLEELQNIQAHKTANMFSSQLEFEQYMKKLGFRVLGSGWFATVFDHPKLDYVLKVAKLDGAYRQFVQYAQANQSDPHLPRFRGKIMQATPDVFMVRMERLQPLGDLQFEHDVEPCFQWAMQGFKGKQTKPLETMRLPTLCRSFANVVAAFNGKPVSSGGKWPAKPVFMDINEENVMCRSDKTVVITDPIAIKSGMK